jgi:hypothetical protein
MVEGGRLRDATKTIDIYAIIEVKSSFIAEISASVGLQHNGRDFILLQHCYAIISYVIVPGTRLQTRLGIVA